MSFRKRKCRAKARLYVFRLILIYTNCNAIEDVNDLRHNWNHESRQRYGIESRGLAENLNSSQWGSYYFPVDKIIVYRLITWLIYYYQLLARLMLGQTICPSIFHHFNLYKILVVPCLNDSKEEGFWKHGGKKEKMLVTSIFSFFSTMFPIPSVVDLAKWKLE